MTPVNLAIAALLLAACFGDPPNALRTLVVGVPGSALLVTLLNRYARRIGTQMDTDLAEIERIRRRTEAIEARIAEMKRAAHPSPPPTVSPK